MTGGDYRVALVTGASAGIGEKISERLSRAGLRVVLVARRAERLREIQQRLGGPSRCHVICCDIRDMDALDAALDDLPADFVPIDVLVNNAGLAIGLEPAQCASWPAWQQVMETNCTALAFLCQRVLPGMVERNRGHIVNIGSIAATNAYAGGNIYSASKAFVAQFSRNLKADLLGTAVRITNIEPGLVGDTEFSKVRFHDDPAHDDRMAAVPNALSPDDIADCVQWVVSRPSNVNICSVEVMPVCQAPGRPQVYRE